MVDKPIKLITRNELASAEAISILEFYLKLAKKGEIRSVGIIGVQPPHGDVVTHFGGEDRVTVLGGTEVLKKQILDDVEEGYMIDGE